MRNQRDRSLSRFSSQKLHEPESKRLQNDIEALTKLLGLQRRRAASLDERVQFYSKEIKAKKDRLRSLLPSTKEEMQLENKLHLLDNQLLKEKVTLNKDLVHNQELRDRIDMYRRDKVAFLGIFRDMEEESSQLGVQAEGANKELLRLEEEDEKYRRQLVALKSRAQTAMDSYQTEAARFQEEIQYDRDQSRTANKSFSDKVYPDSHIYTDNNQILKTLYEKWVGVCKEQKKAVDQYNKTVRYLSDAFMEIKEATGIGSITEMVTGLVKAQEQEQVLLGNLNAAMAQADLLEGRLKELEGHYQALVRAQKSALSRNEDHLNVLHTELVGLRSLFQRKKEKQARLKQEVESVNVPLHRLLNLFRECDLGPETIVEGDVLQLLAQLEKAISFLVQYLSIGKNEGLPAVFEADIPEKVFSEVGKSGLKGAKFEEHEGIDDADRPLSAIEIRQRIKQKFPQLQ